MSLPFVSICTPTFNRPHFIPLLIECIEHQTYPHDKMEWIIIDDGTDHVSHLITDLNIHKVKYFQYETKMPLGQKRNLMHQKCSGDIIIYMDDDDFYPPSRVSHAVESLLNNPQILIAGCSEMHMYHNNAVYKCGPYGKYHSTAATLAFKKEFLNFSCYDDNKSYTEETFFLDNYTAPLIQLDTIKTILVIAHEQNTLDKKCLVEKQQAHGVTLSTLTVDDFIKNQKLKKSYTQNIHQALKNYEFGKLKYKPDVVKNLKERDIAQFSRKLVEDNERYKALLKTNERIMNDQTCVIQSQITQIRALKGKKNETE